MGNKIKELEKELSIFKKLSNLKNETIWTNQFHININKQDYNKHFKLLKSRCYKRELIEMFQYQEKINKLTIVFNKENSLINVIKKIEQEIREIRQDEFIIFQSQVLEQQTKFNKKNNEYQKNIMRFTLILALGVIVSILSIIKDIFFKLNETQFIIYGISIFFIVVFWIFLKSIIEIIDNNLFNFNFDKYKKISYGAITISFIFIISAFFVDIPSQKNNINVNITNFNEQELRIQKLENQILDLTNLTNNYQIQINEIKIISQLNPNSSSSKSIILNKSLTNIN